ncbi:hypothetical protein C4556_01855 [Candidatus Parcubacteria bacterium]|nr:MAG: hypothetical protein C4556_01855 [Candidatus Parcubacteria bacterium]
MSDSRMLRLYVDPAWRRAGALHSPLLFPFWGNPTTEVSLFAKEMFDSYPMNTRLFTVTEKINEADMVFPPYRHSWLLEHDEALLRECVRQAEETGLPLFIDGAGDVEFPVGIENAYVLRIGGYRFLPEKNRIQVPAAADDLLERCAGGRVQIRAKREGEKPIVSFAGWAELTLTQTLRTVAKELPSRLRTVVDSRYRAMRKGVFWRKQALNTLARSDKVELRAIKRRTFSGSAKTAGAPMRRLRQELVDLVLASDYGLDVRGDANESTRLYEILSLGRIPIILDTERNLPFRDVVRYEDFSLIVDFRDIKRLPERIADFHRSVRPDVFEEMQRAARAAFVAHFRTDAHMRHIVRQLEALGALTGNR